MPRHRNPSSGRIRGFTRRHTRRTSGFRPDDDLEDDYRQVEDDEIARGHLVKSRLRGHRAIVALYVITGMHCVSDLKHDLDGCLSPPIKCFIVRPLKMTIQFCASGVP